MYGSQEPLARPKFAEPITYWGGFKGLGYIGIIIPDQ